jgi:class 3 adenylate cyclase
MGLTKKEALHAIAAQARKRAKLDFDERAIPSKSLLDEYLQSPESPYKRFAEFMEALPFKRGGHPDYDYLAELPNVGQTEEGKITTLFMDLKNFTKYCCFLSREKVYQAKYASIESVIGVCRLHGGHLHEIPGDGVMFFFGGRQADDLTAARRALNAATDAMDLLEREVIVEYNDKEQYPSIHPKIGVDHGTALWGAYGAPPLFETKATAFNVDIAHKMMAERASQELAIGDDLKSLLEIDEKKYLEKGWAYCRQLTVSGQKKEVSYQTWVLNWRQYLQDRDDEGKDLARLGTVTFTSPMVITSKTRLGDAPLA